MRVKVKMWRVRCVRAAVFPLCAGLPQDAAPAALGGTAGPGHGGGAGARGCKTNGNVDI